MPFLEVGSYNVSIAWTKLLSPVYRDKHMFRSVLLVYQTSPPDCLCTWS